MPGTVTLPDDSTTDRCPYKQMRGAGTFVQAYAWHQKGELGFLYGEDDLPARFVEAFDILDAGFGESRDRQMRAIRDKAKG